MANYVQGLNPQLLKWARERAGYSLEDIATSFKKDVTVIGQWESGERSPTYNQLERLAYTFYKRPIALFFFPDPPDEPDTKQSFRTLPDFEIENLQPDTLHAIREGKAKQLSLIELNNGSSPSERLIFRDLGINKSSNVVLASKTVREYLNIPLEEQKKWRSNKIALEKWRDAVQSAGVFVFKRSFKQEDVSGFCLSDQEFPVIYLNNSTASSRQIFTLFHELAHILLSTNGVTKRNNRYINVLIGDAKEIEVFCNQFAGEFLVPSSDFDRQLDFNIPTLDMVSRLAKQYRVSREVILRKLLDRNIVSREYYEKTVEEWLQDYKERRAARSPGGDYYATKVTYLGTKYMELAFSHYYQGKCTLQQLADYLDVKAKGIDNLEQRFLRKVASP